MKPTRPAFPATQGAYSSTAEPLAYVYFSTIDDLENHINLLDGSLPAVVDRA
jgi:hypothetical protein